MNRIIILLLILISSSYALDLDSRRERIINIIDEELAEVKRLSKQSQRPDYLLRIAELNLEKARLYREKENQDYLKLTAAQRRKANKRRYFRDSTKFFNEASKVSLAITKRYKKYKNIADVYYILGFNAKESNNQKLATKYFSLATKKSSKNSKANIRSKISLAELYFNQRKYKSAAYLYEKALKYHNDKWWTKDSFNQAWSYYRIGKKTSAIKKMKEVYRKSKSPNYVDMRAQVERDIGVMFATSGKVNEGISFYKGIDIDFAPMLVGIATNLKSQGKYSDANRVLKEALKYSKSEELTEQVYIEQLDLFAKYNRYRSHLNVAKKIFSIKKKVATSTLDRLLFHSKKQGARLQKQVTAKTYKRLPKIRKSKAAMAIDYFGIVANLNPKDTQEYLFLQAETARVVGNDLSAFRNYEKTYEHKSKRFDKQAMDGMLSSLGSRRISQSIKNASYEKVYQRFLKDFPRDKRAKTIYQKLFKVYLEKKDYKNAKRTLDRYAKAYKKDYKSQEAMIGSLIEIDRKKKDYPAIKLWVSSVMANEYTVSSKYKTKLKELLTSVQIDGVQSELEKGNKKVALAGYLNVLKDPYATKKAKINAKYNIAALYFELRDIERSSKWSHEAINEMNPKQVAQFSSSFLTISKFYFIQLEFDKSIRLSEAILNKTCNSSNRVKNIAFKNAAFLALADNKLPKAESLVKKAKACKLYASYISEVQFELLKIYNERSMWRNTESLINELAKKRSNRGKLISNIASLEAVHRKLGNSSFAAKLYKKKMNYYAEAKRKKYTMDAEDLDVIAKLENKSLARLSKRAVSSSLVFPESRFNKSLKSKLADLDRVTSKAIQIQKIGSGAGIVESYQSLISTYDSVIRSIQNFTPPGKSANYVKSFKKSMQNLVVPLNKTLKSYKRNALDSINKNEILSTRTANLMRELQGVAVEFKNNTKGVLMDRGGF